MPSRQPGLRHQLQTMREHGIRSVYLYAEKFWAPGSGMPYTYLSDAWASVAATFFRQAEE